MSKTDSKRFSLTTVATYLGIIGGLIGVWQFLIPVFAASYECWDGSREARKADCSTPAGKDGLTWVFPSLHVESCHVTVPVKSDKLVVYVCPFATGEGRGLVRYTAWSDVTPAMTYYRHEFVHRQPRVASWKGEGVGLRWSTDSYVSPRGLPYKESTCLYQIPYSWSVEGSGAAARTFGANAIRLRDPSHWGYELAPGFIQNLRRKVHF